MAARRNSDIPTITVVDSAEKNKIARRTCCGCISEIVGVSAILSMYFFLGMFITAASFVSLGYVNLVPYKVALGISGCLHAFVAIASALGISAIKKEKVILMRRLSIAIWILTALLLISNVASFIIQYVVYKSEGIQECINDNQDQPDVTDIASVCTDLFNTFMTREAIGLFIRTAVSFYFAHVIFRFANNMKKEDLPFTAPANGQNTPTYFVYSNQPPTSTNWVPPPTYTVRPTNPLPDDFNPDSKQYPPNYQ